jgi:phosphohistidine phosphatase SixA
MLLHLLRHAHAGDPETWQGDDSARPLSDKGQAQARRLARHLEAIGFSADRIISSPKVRAAQTAEPVAERIGLSVVIDDRLAGGLDLDDAEAVLRDAGDPDSAVLVGHDPDFSDLLAMLCGAAGVSMRKGALARIEIDRPLVAGAGTLRWLLPPDALKSER